MLHCTCQLFLVFIQPSLSVFIQPLMSVSIQPSLYEDISSWPTVFAGLLCSALSLNPTLCFSTQISISVSYLSLISYPTLLSFTLSYFWTYKIVSSYNLNFLNLTPVSKKRTRISSSPGLSAATDNVVPNNAGDNIPIGQLNGDTIDSFKCLLDHINVAPNEKTQVP